MGVGCFPHRRLRGPLQSPREPRAGSKYLAFAAQLTARGQARPPRRRKAGHGELLLDLEWMDLLQCGLVLALGFLPLGVIHWADPTMKLNAGRLTRRLHRPGWPRTGLVAIVAQWVADLLS